MNSDWHNISTLLTPHESPWEANPAQELEYLTLYQDSGLKMATFIFEKWKLFSKFEYLNKKSLEMCLCFIWQWKKQYNNKLNSWKKILDSCSEIVRHSGGGGGGGVKMQQSAFFMLCHLNTAVNECMLWFLTIYVERCVIWYLSYFIINNTCTKVEVIY